MLDVENIYQSDDISKQIELLRSEEFFKRVIDALDLSVSYFNEGEVLVHEQFRNSPYEIGHEEKDPLVLDQRIYIHFNSEQEGIISYQMGGAEYQSRFIVGDSVETPHFLYMVHDRNIQGMISSPGFSENDYFFTLNSKIKTLKENYSKYRVELLNASAKTIIITVQNTNQLKASTIANKITEEFIKYDKERLSEGAIQVLNFIDEQLSEVYGRLKESEVRLKEFKQDNRLTESNQIAQGYIEQMNRLEQQKATLEVQLGILL